MIKKLQRKFIMITMGSLLVVMFLLIGTINAINLYQTEEKIDGAIRILTENRGKFPKFEKDGPPGDYHKFGFEINEETQFQIRYFTVKADEEGNVIRIDTSHIAAVTSDDAAEYADAVLSEEKTVGYQGIYKYQVVEETDGYMIVFLDCRTQLQTAMSFLLVSCIVAAATLLVMFVLVSILSKRAMKPFAENLEKQKLFITDAGHEIKTPLAIISANADVLELTGGDNEWITSIRNQVIRLDKLVKNLLTLSKMDEDHIKMSFKEVNLSAVFIETADSFKTITEAKNKNFRIEVQPEIMFLGDESSMEQLVSTLLDNAVKYSDEQGDIKASLRKSKKGILLEVYNTVENLDAANLNRLFDRFYRADSSRARDTGGYGIGLSIAKSIVEAHHGKITAKSEDGKSICFTAVFKYPTE